MDLYRAEILDHYKHPHHFGHLATSDVEAEAYNATCGDMIRMEIKLDKGKVGDISFTGEGCAISQAAGSLLTDFVLGKSLTEVRSLGSQQILEMIGATLTPSRVKCALLPLEVLQKAVFQVAKNGARHVK